MLHSMDVKAGLERKADGELNLPLTMKRATRLADGREAGVAALWLKFIGFGLADVQNIIGRECLPAIVMHVQPVREIDVGSDAFLLTG
jgi:hypothetical protein